VDGLINCDVILPYLLFRTCYQSAAVIIIRASQFKLRLHSNAIYSTETPEGFAPLALTIRTYGGVIKHRFFFSFGPDLTPCKDSTDSRLEELWSAHC
jgi:hypothetical protein